MKQSSRNVAMRTCVGCRQNDNRDGLLRLVLLGDPPQVVPDIKRKAHGRGVSVHPNRHCVESAVRSRALERAFRHDALSLPSIGELINWICEQYGRRMNSLLLSALRSRQIALGTVAVFESIKKSQLELLIVSKNATKSKKELIDRVATLGRSGIVFGTKESNGKLLGRRFISVLAILDYRIARQLLSAYMCSKALAEDS